MVKDIIGDRSVIVYDHPYEDWGDRIIIDAQKDNDNVIVNKLSMHEASNGDMVAVISRHVKRPRRKPGDQFSDIKKYVPVKINGQDTIDSIIQRVEEKKVADVVLPFSRTVDEFNPETDINTDNNVLLIERPLADVIEGSGWNMDGIVNEYESMESVAPTQYQSNLVYDVGIVKTAIKEIIKRLQAIVVYHQNRNELNRDIRTVRDLLAEQTLPQDVNRELQDFIELYKRYMEMQKAIAIDSFGRIQIPRMYIDIYETNKDEFLDEIVSQEDNGVRADAKI